MADTKNNTNNGVGLISGIANVAGLAMNAYQYNQEKKRQQRLDNYNKALNDRNFYAQQLANSPAYQKQLQKDAGYNPLAQGIQPDLQSPQAGNPVAGNPMPTTPTGQAIQDTSKNITDVLLQNQSLDLQKKQLQLQQDNIDYQIQQGKAEFLLQQYKDKVIKDEESLNKALKDHNTGFIFDGQSLQREIAEVDLEDKQQNVLGKKLQNQRGQIELKYFDDKQAQELERLIIGNQTMKVDKQIKDLQKLITEVERADKELAHFAHVYETGELPRSIRRMLNIWFDYSKETRQKLIGTLSRNMNKGAERAIAVLELFEEAESDIENYTLDNAKTLVEYIKKGVEGLKEKFSGQEDIKPRKKSDKTHLNTTGVYR